MVTLWRTPFNFQPESGPHKGQVFAKVATYKGRTVAVKKVPTMKRFYANQDALVDIRTVNKKWSQTTELFNQYTYALRVRANI